MVYRISSTTANDNLTYYLKQRQHEMDKVNHQINTGKKVRIPREDPVAAAHGMTHNTKISMIKQFARNIESAEGELGIIESRFNSTIEIMQRVRELTVQGANGTYSAQDRKYIAVEIDQLLNETISIANSQYKGNFLFSGFQLDTKPFQAITGIQREAGEELVKEVLYFGDGGFHQREIDTDEYLAVNLPGNFSYWAEPFRIHSRVSTADFRLVNDQTIRIDNEVIRFQAGDNIYNIIEKINLSNASVNASLDPTSGALVFVTTRPHQPIIEDIEGGNLMQRLGILETNSPSGPNNFSKDAIIFGGSVFDVLINIRDAMFNNNADEIGSKSLASIDAAIENITYQLAELGSKSNRLKVASNRILQEKVFTMDILSKTEGVDLADAITELKKFEYAHKASLGTSARIMQPTLLDYLR